MHMQRRHFEFIAKVLRECPQGADRSKIIHMFAHELRRTNPNFNKARFIEAAFPEYIGAE